MPGIIPDYNSELDQLINYDPSSADKGLFQVTDVGLDDDQEDFVETVLDEVAINNNVDTVKKDEEALKKAEQEALDALK